MNSIWFNQIFGWEFVVLQTWIHAHFQEVFGCMLGVGVEVWTYDILCWFIKGPNSLQAASMGPCHKLKLISLSLRHFGHNYVKCTQKNSCINFKHWENFHIYGVLPTSILWQPGSATSNSLTPGQQNILNCVFRFEQTLFSLQPLLIGYKHAFRARWSTKSKLPT